MDRRTRIGLTISAAAVVLVAFSSFAFGEKEAEPQGMPPEMAEYMKLAEPGEHHAHLAKMVGSWKAHSKFVMAPGAPPEESDGTMTVKAVLDGRFFVSEFRGTMMGKPFHGLGLDGYDNAKKRHVATWADSMGTMIVWFEGTCSQGGKVLEMRSSFEDPVTGKPTSMRAVTTWKNDDTLHWEMFAPGPDGKEMKMGEILYTRT